MFFFIKCFFMGFVWSSGELRKNRENKNYESLHNIINYTFISLLFHSAYVTVSISYLKINWPSVKQLPWVQRSKQVLKPDVVLGPILLLNPPARFSWSIMLCFKALSRANIISQIHLLTRSHGSAMSLPHQFVSFCV